MAPPNEWPDDDGLIDFQFIEQGGDGGCLPVGQFVRFRPA